MSWLRNTIPAAVFAFALVVTAAHAHAQETTGTSANPLGAEAVATPADTLAQEVAAAKTSLDANTELTEEQRAQVQKLLDAALAELESLRKAEAAANADAQVTMGAESESRTLTTEIANLKEAPAPKADSDPTRLEAQLSEAEARLAALEQQRSEFKDAQARAEERKRVSEQETALRQELETISKSLAASPPEGDPPLLTQAQQVQLKARKLAIEKQLAANAARLARFSKEDALDLPADRREFLNLQISQLTTFVDTLRTEVADLRIRAARSRIAKAAKLRGEIPASYQEALGPVTDAAQAYAEDELRVRQDRQRYQRRLETVKSELATIQNQLEQARARVDRIGLTPALGLRLRGQRENLEDPRAIAQRMQDRFPVLERAQLEFLDRSEEFQQLDAADQALTQPLFARVDEQLEALDPDDRDDAGAIRELQSQRRLIQNVVDCRRENLRELEQAYEQYTVTLDELDSLAGQWIEATESFASFIDEHILWIRSHKPLSRESLADDKMALVWLLNGGRKANGPNFLWSVANAVWHDLRGNYVIWVIGIGVWLVLVARGVRFRNKIRELADAAEHRVQIEMRPTWEAWVATTLISITWTGLLLFVAWRLSASANGEVSDWAGRLLPIGFAFLYIEFFRQTWRRGGLAESHFGWSSRLLTVLRRASRQLIWLGMPVAVVVAALGAREHDSSDESDAIEMIGFIVGLVILAHCTHRLLSSKRGVLREAAVEQPGGWLDRTKTLAWLVGLAVPLGLIVLVSLGYYNTAQALLWNVAITVWLLLSIVFIRSMLYRWLTIRHRRVRLDQLRERRAAAAEGAGSTEAPSNLPDVATEERIDLEAVGQQTRRLVSTTLFIASLAGLWAVWGDVLPALHYLDNWVLWEDQVTATETVEAPDGTSEVRVTTEIVEITLVNFLWCVLILGMTLTAARNVPGLLELTILQRLPLDASVRYAVTTLTRYVLVLLGIIVASNSLGIGWSNVQWLAAALTVGLGFGLQEIFANFVSGVIILFEQPVRVGDIVTIDGVTGVVSRIRIRATTITDWDRKEYIVPNREFITGRLLNWTLKDTTNRVVINVGVAYGSDTDKVKEILLKVAEEHDNVLSDPPPMVTFEGFGDSSLNFVVRAYLPSLDQRLNTIHDLHSRIHRAFAEAGIEIPFPQRDLHMRSMPEGSSNGADAVSGGHGNGSAQRRAEQEEQPAPARAPDE